MILVKTSKIDGDRWGGKAHSVIDKTNDEEEFILGLDAELFTKKEARSIGEEIIKNDYEFKDNLEGKYYWISKDNAEFDLGDCGYYSAFGWDGNAYAFVEEKENETELYEVYKQCNALLKTIMWLPKKYFTERNARALFELMTEREKPSIRVSSNGKKIEDLFFVKSILIGWHNYCVYTDESLTKFDNIIIVIDDDNESKIVIPRDGIKTDVIKEKYPNKFKEIEMCLKLLTMEQKKQKEKNKPGRKEIKLKKEQICE